MTSITPGSLRLQKDLVDLELPNNCQLSFPDKSNILKFHVDIEMTEGLYEGGKFKFEFTIPNLYPHKRPRVKCLTETYHPNIDEEGHVCLNIIREDWKPILSITPVIFGLFQLFMEPCAENPLRQDAADMMKNDPAEYARIVRNCIRKSQLNEQ